MPWKECNQVDERLKFVARLLEGEKMSPLCEEFGISRKTGDKIFDRYKASGLEGLTDRSKRPVRYANQLPLSVGWLRLGIAIERIEPGKPQQNGRHERMHLPLKKEATKPAGENFLQQQTKFDKFIHEYNQERPHQALKMKYPSEVYTPSSRSYKGLPDVDYPFHDMMVTVTHCGRICLKGKKINFSVVFAGQNVGIKEVDDQIWLVSFMGYDLGYFDEQTCKLEPLVNPFGPKVLPMSSA